MYDFRIIIESNSPLRYIKSDDEAIENIYNRYQYFLPMYPVEQNAAFAGEGNDWFLAVESIGPKRCTLATVQRHKFSTSSRSSYKLAVSASRTVLPCVWIARALQPVRDLLLGTPVGQCPSK